MNLYKLTVGWLWLLPVILRPCVASDTVNLHASGFPPVHCNLSTLHHSSGGEVALDDFWMRGAASNQFYRCHIDANDQVREKIFANSRRGHLKFSSQWSVILYRLSDTTWSSNRFSATTTPSFACITDGDGAPTALPEMLFPLSARRSTDGGARPWHKCVPVHEGFHVSPFLSKNSLVTVAFHSGAPTIACGITNPIRRIVSAVKLRGLLGAPYACFFATYLDFPSLNVPSANVVFQRHVLEKWAVKQSNLLNVTFHRFQCWSAADDADRRFDFDVVFDGEHTQRCHFQGDCPLCDQAASPTENLTNYLTSTQVPSNHDDTTAIGEFIDFNNMTTH